MRKRKTAVLFGGCSSEHEVSLQSAYWVLKGLNKEKTEVIPIGITENGDWYRYNGNYEKIKNNVWKSDKENLVPVTVSLSRSQKGLLEFKNKKTILTPIDSVFPVLHGKNGEDGTVQGLFNLAGIEVVGCGTLSSALCMDKYRAHLLVETAGIAVPKSVLMKRGRGNSIQGIENLNKLKYPLFVKPVRCGSSFGISKVKDERALEEALDLAFSYDDRVIAEENVEGREVGCAVMEAGGGDRYIVGKIDEIELQKDFFDYTEKYTLGTSKVNMPANIDSATEERLKNTALKIYDILDCSGFARVDMFLKGDGEIVFNEVNTIPGFTSHSRFPNMMKGIGFSFEEMLEKLIDTIPLGKRD